MSRLILTDEIMTAGLREAEERATRWPYAREAAMVGRGYAWLDDPAMAREWFARGFELVARQPELDWSATALGGFLLQRIGRDAEARKWLKRARKMAKHRPDYDRGELAYLAGDLKDAVKLTEAESDVSLTWAVARSQLGHKVDLQARRERFVAGFDQALAPYDSSYSGPFTEWEWLEELFRVQCELEGTAMPTHREMLLRSGLLRQHPPTALELVAWTGSMTPQEPLVSDGLRDFIDDVAQEMVVRHRAGDDRVWTATAQVNTRDMEPPRVEFTPFADEAQARRALRPQRPGYVALASTTHDEIEIIAHAWDDEIADRFHGPVPDLTEPLETWDPELDQDADALPRLIDWIPDFS